MMRLSSAVAAGFFFSVLASAPAFADGEDNQITYISPSIIMIGTPDPCDNGACEEDVATVEPKSDSNAALVDAYGMPTSMPVIMRPSVDTAAPTVVPAPAEPAVSVPEQAAAPAAEPAPAPAANPEVAPAPVEQAPAAPNSNS